MICGTDMHDAQLRLTKPIYQKSFDYGGMFRGRKQVFLDPDTSDKPYLALATDGWGRGYGRRYQTQEEAQANLDRLAQKV